MSDLKTIFSHNPNCLVRGIADSLIIMPPEGDVTHTLGAMETFIWERFDGQNDLQFILEALLEQYDVPEDVAREDLLAFSAQLHLKGLIQDS